MGWVRERLAMDGKVAVVTGAGRGIGRSIAIGLADAGAKVIIGEFDSETGPDTERVVRDAGGEALWLPTDVRERQQIVDLVEGARTHFGRIDVMVNHVGGAFQLPSLDLSENGLDSILRINLKAMFFGSQAAARAMIEEGHGGSIVSTASVAGLRGSSIGLAHYSAAKAAILGMTRSLAAEWAPHGIRVNAVAPGAVDTDGRLLNMQGDPAAGVEDTVPMGRLAQPEEIAAAAVFLASDLAGFVNGHTLVVDGGASTASRR